MERRKMELYTILRYFFLPLLILKHIDRLRFKEPWLLSVEATSYTPNQRRRPGPTRVSWRRFWRRQTSTAKRRLMRSQVQTAPVRKGSFYAIRNKKWNILCSWERERERERERESGHAKRLVKLLDFCVLWTHCITAWTNIIITVVI